mmetsp:Transcript_93480/g.260327  ORF Transcript_93480/g.260327 Transcript_93480/m.260327 type:complete len:386 (+) Transcript_93480:57-1214(+)
MAAAAATAVMELSPLRTSLSLEQLDSAGVLAENPQQGSMQEVDPHINRGKLTGWLLKRKSDGVRSRFFRSVNRRFFTLDFEGQLFYYAHTEGNKMASMPLAFRNLLGVEPLAAMLHQGAPEEPAAPPMQRAGSKVLGSKCDASSSSFRVPKITFSALKRPAEHHGFSLQTTGKEMELLCASQIEAEGWIAALQQAIALGAESRSAAESTDEPQKVDVSTSAGSSPEAPLSPRSEEEDSVPEFLVPQSTPEAEANMQLEGPLLPSPRGVEAFAGDLQRATEKEQEAKEVKGVKPSRRGLGGLLPRRLQRHRAQSEAAPDTGVVTSLEFEAALLRDAGNQAWAEEEGDKVASTEAAEVSRRYEDKGQGLSLKERLAQMDFSDDEDEP